jgi:heptosyltransferase-2
VLVVLPSWLGDTAMATPALGLLRAALPSSVIVGLCRPGIDELLAGTDFLDDCVVMDTRSVLGPAKAAARLKPFRLGAALLLPNSFASAVTVRLAGVPIRVGYDRDGRGPLLTHHLHAPKRTAPAFTRPGGWAPVSAVDYYLAAARALLAALGDAAARRAPQHDPPMALGVTTIQDLRAQEVLHKGGIQAGEPFALLNPGGNNPAKRWPVERFAAVAHELIARRGLKVAINGSPGEAGLVRLIRDAVALNEPADAARLACLPELGGTIGSLKGIVRRARVMVTNDTGPRHLAAAFGIPCVTLFGPTDPRWTRLPPTPARPAHDPGAPEGGDPTPPGWTWGQGEEPGSLRPREIILTADPTLPPEEVADDHPERCRIERIATHEVLGALARVLGPG